MFALVLAPLLAAVPARSFVADVRAGKAVYATFETTEGSFVCRLLSKEAPDAVAAFVGYADGETPWKDTRSPTVLHGPIYDGTWFYRAVPDFAIQGGDPFDTGLIPPGYPFDDPVKAGGTFDAKGALATVATGPHPYGSEFFVSDAPLPWLDGRYTVFGQVVAGMDVVDRIAHVPVGIFNRPLTPVVLKHVTLSLEPPAAPASAKQPPAVKERSPSTH